MIILLGSELIPLSDMDDLSCPLVLTGVLVGEMKDRADPGRVMLQQLVRKLYKHWCGKIWFLFYVLSILV